MNPLDRSRPLPTEATMKEVYGPTVLPQMIVRYDVGIKKRGLFLCGIPKGDTTGIYNPCDFRVHSGPKNACVVCGCPVTLHDLVQVG